jgi:hypothetical protein
MLLEDVNKAFTLLESYFIHFSSVNKLKLYL